jgi:hypothetical protein
MIIKLFYQVLFESSVYSYQNFHADLLGKAWEILSWLQRQYGWRDFLVFIFALFLLVWTIL